MSGSGSTAITTYENAVLIYNPLARGLNGLRRKRIDRVLHSLAECGHKVTAVTTTGPGSAGGIALQSIRNGADLIIVAGGDGTINEAMNGMVSSEVPLAILPGGTANVLAHELGIGPDMETAARALGSWGPRRISVGALRTGAAAIPRYFLMMAGIGFDAHIVNHVNLELKKRHGKLSYWIAGFAELGRKLEDFEVHAGGRRFVCSYALASRVRNYGGTVTFARDASLLADDFAVVLLEGRNAFRYLKFLAGVLLGTLEKMSGVVTLRARSLEICAALDRQIYVQIDGEAGGRIPASLEIVPNAITLLVPSHFKG